METFTGCCALFKIPEKVNESGPDPTRSMGNFGIGALNDVTVYLTKSLKEYPNGSATVGKTYGVGAVEFATMSETVCKPADSGADTSSALVFHIAFRP